MTTQRTMFDSSVENEERLKDEALATAEERAAVQIAFCRGVAVAIAEGRPDRTVAADDVKSRLAELGVGIEWGPWAGAIFKDDTLFEHTGTYRKSRAEGMHRRMISVWRLREGILL